MAETGSKNSATEEVETGVLGSDDVPAGWPEPLSVTNPTKLCLETFRGQLATLAKSKEISAGAWVALVANLNAHGIPIPAHLVEGVGRFEGAEKFERLIDEIRQKVRGEWVEFEPPSRSQVGRFSVQHNPIRGYRPIHTKPGGISSSEATILGDPENDAQVFAETDCGMKAELMFNRYPFAPYHFLWIPYRKAKGAFHRGQRLSVDGDRDLIEGMWDFVSSGGMGDSFRLGYNSSGAHASVPDFHAHGFWLTKEWQPPIERALGNGQNPRLDYFPNGQWIPVSQGAEALRGFIREMEERSEKSKNPLAYNLYMTPRGTMAFPRRSQWDERYSKQLRESPFTSGFGFFEMAGEIICPNREAFERLLKGQGEQPILKLFDSLDIDK